jgi:hypothetical protein
MLFFAVDLYFKKKKKIIFILLNYKNFIGKNHLPKANFILRM